MKPHIKTLPCFPQVAAVIGESRAQIELFKAHWSFRYYKELTGRPWIGGYKLIDSFSWATTKQGHYFWSCINDGINPYND